MYFVSYAQNREDVMLRRALAGVVNGFYVDIGAQDPDKLSVTKTFYEAGWRGINVEPVSHWYKKLVHARPEDVNICAMVGTSDRPVQFFEIEGTGLSTADKEQAEIHRNEGYPVNQTTVTPIRLDAVLATHNVGVIHFLKIDVEGSEDDVLRSIDLQTWRPWILVIEATIPLSSELANGVWQQYVEAASYEFVYFDGLNKYFVSKEQHELKKAFSTPPNVFDQYVTAGEKENEENIKKLMVETDRSQRLAVERDFALLDNKRLSARIAAKRTELQSARDDFEVKRIELQSAYADLEAAHVQLHLTQNSLSWRVTRPLRAVRSTLRNFLLAHSGIRRAWLSVRPTVVRVMRTVVRK